MKFRHFVVALALSAPLAAGCKTPPGLAAMERELRYQEDMIYQLQDYIHTYKSHLNSCRAENQSLRQTSASLPTTSNGTPSNGTPANGNGQPMEVVPVEPDNGQNGELQPPQIELPPLSANRPISPTAVNDPFEVVELDQENRPVQVEQPQPTEIAAETDDQTAPVSYDSPLDVGDPVHHEAVATLSLNPRRTGAYRQDHQRDTDGIQVWLEPRGASGRIVRTGGTATIAVLDPSKPRSAKPLARWQVKSADLRRFQTRDGIRLKLSWPQEAPQQSDVLVFVRMITSDGLWIYADQSVRLDSRLIDAAAPAVAARRPDKPQTVSPTAHDQPLDKPLPKATRQASAEAVSEKKEAVSEKKGWAAAAPPKPQPQVGQAGSHNAPQRQPTSKAEPAPVSVPKQAAAPQPAPPPAAQPKQPPPAPPEPKAAPQRPRQRPQWAPLR